MNDKQIVTIQVRLSEGLKDDFEKMCQENEISMSNKVRELIANTVRNHKRKNAKVDEVF